MKLIIGINQRRLLDNIVFVRLEAEKEKKMHQSLMQLDAYI